MAEFVEVMRQMKRMCANLSPTCNGCKLCLGKGTNEFCGEQPKDILSNLTLVESVVMQWAAEHPEPVYPTWRELLGKLYPDAELIMDAIDQKIPADIAEKLGIEPKEG